MVTGLPAGPGVGASRSSAASTIGKLVSAIAWLKAGEKSQLAVDGQVEPDLAIVGDVDRVALLGQAPLDGLGELPLVLDDQEYLREIMSTILNDAGYPTVAVGTTEHALRLLDEFHPDVLVLDVSLPDVGGLQFLDRLRAQAAWKTLPVIVVSGDPVKLAGADGQPFVVALSKPFDSSVLVDAVSRFLSPTVLPQSA